MMSAEEMEASLSAVSAVSAEAADEPQPAAPAVKVGAPSMTVQQVLAMDPAGVIATMQHSEHGKVTELMGACCKQLRVLCRDDQQCVQCDELGAAFEVAKAMAAHAKVPEVQQQACAAIINLCSARRVEPRDRAANSGVLSTIVQAMQLHLVYPGIQEMAIIAIQNVIIGTDTRDKERKARAIDSGAFKAISDAVKRYESTTSVFEQGTATIRLLCSKDSALKGKAIAAGAKKEWFKGSGGLSTRLGFTSRKAGNKGP